MQRDETSLREGERILTICNACRYCEGYCAVFPAMEKRVEFGRADLNYLANLCHNCQECFYACQYAPPHEFAVNVPKTLAQIRVDSYEEYAWPFWARKLTSGIAWLMILSAAASWGRMPPVPNGDFYRAIPHQVMVAFFGGLGLFAAAMLLIGAVRFYKATASSASAPAIRKGLRDALRLEYLRSGGTGCTYPDEHHSQARRWFHHLTFYGFLLCFASTTVAAIYHYAFDWIAPYGYLSLPVMLGTLGGIALVVGPLVLGWLRMRQDPATANKSQTPMDLEFISLLFLTSLTGLLMLALRATPNLSGMLAVHLGCVAALFLTMPYGKFVHGLYRFLALVRYAREQE